MSDFTMNIKTRGRPTSTYNGTEPTNEQLEAASKLPFSSKFEAFTYAVNEGWSKKAIMTYMLQNERPQYFYNYMEKYIARKN
jgi:hypothetical protein